MIFDWEKDYISCYHRVVEQAILQVCTHTENTSEISSCECISCPLEGKDTSPEKETKDEFKDFVVDIIQRLEDISEVGTTGEDAVEMSRQLKAFIANLQKGVDKC